MEQKDNCTASAYNLEPLSASLAMLLLRVWLGVRSLLSGIEKFAGYKVERKPLLDEFGQEDIYGTMVDVREKVYGFSHYQGVPKPLYDKFAQEPLMPVWALDLYGALLGVALLALGVTLLLGIAPRISLFVSGLVYASLTVGLILINEASGVAWLGIHMVLVVLALLLTRYNRWSLYNKC